MKRFVCFLMAAFGAISVYAQEPDSLRIREPLDTTVSEKVDSLFVTGMEGLVRSLPDSAALAGAVSVGRPSETVRDFDGAMWWTYDLDGVILSLDVRYLHEYGRYYRIGVHLLNTSPQALDFDFDAVRLLGDDGRSIRVYSQNDYLRRVRRKQNWRHFGAQVAMVPLYLFALAVAENVTDFNDDGWHSLGESLAEGLAVSIIDGAASVGSGLISAHYGNEAERIRRDNLGYLHDFRIAPDHVMEGHFFGRYDPAAREVTLLIPVGAKVYRIPFLNVGLPQVGKELE